MAFRLLALAVPDPVKMEIKISYPERDIMECTLVIIVFSVNAGNIMHLSMLSRWGGRPGKGGGFDVTSLPAVGTFDHWPSPGGRNF